MSEHDAREPGGAPDMHGDGGGGGQEALRALASARRRPIPVEAGARLRARLAAETGALAMPPGVVTVTAPARTPWGRLALAALALFGAGVGVGFGLARRGETPRLVAVSLDQRPAPPPSGAVALAHAEPAAAVEPPAPEVPSSPPRHEARAGGRDTDLSAERAILEIARTANTRRDWKTALDALARHARDFPRGRLEEERESLYVLALAQAGRSTEARDHAARFRRRFPDSLLLPAVEAALETPGAGK